MRILQVVGCMNRGGAETCLMHVLRHVDPVEYQMDFLVHTLEQCAYDEEIHDRGSLVIPCLNYQNPLQYARNFKRVIAEYGPYDIVHSHVHYYTGFVLRLARSTGVKTVIAHSRTDARGPERRANLPRRMYVGVMKRMVSRYADYGLAVSRKTAEDLFGKDWASDPRWRVLYSGIDLVPFKQAVDQAQIRAEFRIPEKAYVVGHVGNFGEEKNHAFLVDIASRVAKSDTDIRFLLIGDGPLRPRIRRKVDEMGLEEQVIFTGVRGDVPELMLGAMDAFILPSVQEGLPMVLIEAQAAGLPCLFSNFISDEVDTVEHLINRLPVEGPDVIWADVILSLKSERQMKDPKAVTIMEQSVFNIKNSVKELLNVYAGCK